MKNRLIYILLLVLLLSDYSWSFYQYHHTMIQGDMAGSIVPNNEVQKLFNDPFGIKIIFGNERYGSPNRYFPNLLLKDYFRTAPSLLQFFTSPAESVYLASALIKILAHVLIVYFLSVIITGTRSIFQNRLLFVSVLITPLFQTYGFNYDMGIIDISIAYCFFYAVSIMLLMLFLYLFYDYIFKANQKTNTFITILLLVLSVILSFSGPLIPPTIVILAGLLFIHYILNYIQIGKQQKSIKGFIKFIPNEVKLVCLPITLLSLYSVYLATFDTQFLDDLIPLSERYLKLLAGIDKTFISKSGFRALFILIAINCLIIRLAYYNDGGKKIFKNLLWIIVFSAIYLFILPLGGYRVYRPYIIRYDTIIPITLLILFIYSLSSYFIVNQIKGRVIKIIYLILLICFIYPYARKDRNIVYDNKCEKEALMTIAESKEKIVPLSNNCSVISWDIITDYRESELNGEMIKILGITKDKKMYFSINSNPDQGTIVNPDRK